MSAPNRNTLWASVFVDELARAGLQAACIAQPLDENWNRRRYRIAAILERQRHAFLFQIQA